MCDYRQDAGSVVAEQNDRKWLCSADRPTISDLACFPYVGGA
jgi:hypothetical protein